MKRSLTLIAVVALLVVVSVFVFAACMPSDPAKAKANYEKAGYTATLVTDEDGSIGGALKGLASLVSDAAKHTKAVLTVYNDKYAGTVTYYDTADYAKEVTKKAKENADDGVYVKRDGKAVFIGDKEAYNKKKA